MISNLLRRTFRSGRSDDQTVIDLRDSAERKVVELQVPLPPDHGQDLADAVVEEISVQIERIGAFARDQGIPDEVSQRMQIGLDEIMVNTASYSGAESLLLRGWANDGRLTIQVSDDGLPFNPLENAAPQTDAPLQERELGGLGIHLIRSLMSEVEYTFVDGRNVVTLIAEVG